METGPSLVRALIAVKRAGAHMINMSYGEPSAWCGGRFFEARVVAIRASHS
jgi:hypothetical protein